LIQITNPTIAAEVNKRLIVDRYSERFALRGCYWKRDIRAQHVAEAVLILAQDVRMLAPEAEAFEKEIPEIGGIEGLEAFLVRGIEPSASPLGECACFSGRHLLGPEAAVLPTVDQCCELTRGVTLLVDVFRFDDLFQKSKLIVRQKAPTGIAAALSGATAATVQLRASDAPAPSCFGMATSVVTRNDGLIFKAKTP